MGWRRCCSELLIDVFNTNTISQIPVGEKGPSINEPASLNSKRYGYFKAMGIKYSCRRQSFKLVLVIERILTEYED
ncbi:BBT_HP_G0132140.mRNA.1.CDS.1 [Saccharomyces cerevisiae]|nr:BBT_HP_G0132140.mRNA.1.CDS.1 [Saccharomyces cerevisiae]CAI6975806.1 BBT_HP_G0132140.mRNA.1.CDS.1 [Saccharomyces cerevisiae]